MKPTLIFFCLTILFFAACTKGDETPVDTTTIPTVTTSPITNLQSTSVQCGGNVTQDGGTSVSARGICWSTSANPTIQSNHTTDGSGTGNFISSITGLTPLTTYYLRTYATNAKGTAYGNEVNFTTPASEPDIYVAGNDGNIATIWKNGNAVNLNSLSEGYGQATSVVVTDNNDIYACGTMITSIPNGNRRVSYWKNGTITIITDGTKVAECMSIAISGNDVYIGGYESNGSKWVAKTWKNGVATTLSDGSNNATVYSVALAGNDVYAAGYDGNKAVVWKNGVATNLTDGNFPSRAFSVFVSGTDIYVAGSETLSAVQNFGIGTIWKNSVPVTRLTTGTPSSASGLFVSGSDVYASGSNASVPTIWKNGVPTALPANTTTPSLSTQLFVKGGNTYIAGYENTPNGIQVKYWKNNTAINLTAGNTIARAYGIFVK